MKFIIMIFLLICTLCFCRLGYAEIGIGSTQEEVIQTYGQPTGELTSGDERVLSYPGGIISIRDGKVVHIDDEFEKKLKKRKAEKIFKAKQKAKGLLYYKGRWMSSDEKRWLVKKEEERLRKLREKNLKRGISSSRGRSIQKISNGGQRVDLSSLLVKDKITIVDFYADWCGPCRKISPHLEELANQDADVYLKKVDIVKWGTPVTIQYRINSVPNVRVYDDHGRMVGEPTASFGKVSEYVKKAKR